MRFLCTALLLALLSITAMPAASMAASDISPAKRAAIIQLMETTGSKNIGLQMGSAMIQNLVTAMKTGNPDLPDRAVAIIAEETRKLVEQKIDDLLKTIVPIYDQYFTADEINELLAFYQTPIGKKTISVLPRLTQASMLAGQNWGQELFPELVKALQERFQAEGIEIK